jgi:DNA-binding protein HU-beta
MNKKELVSAIADEVEITKDKAGAAIDALFTRIEKSLKKGDEVRIPGFGTFKVSNRAARTARNPQTGATMKLKATRVPRFAAAKSLKEAVAK